MSSTSTGMHLSPEALIAAVDAGRRDDVARLHALIRRTAPRLAPGASGKMLGYGPFHYRYASGREGDTFRIGLAANKQYLSLYVLAVDAGGYVAERYRTRLPRADIGKCCVRFKRLDDLDPEALVSLLKEAAATPYGDAEVGPAKRKVPAAKAASAPKTLKAPSAKQRAGSTKTPAKRAAAKQRKSAARR